MERSKGVGILGKTEMRKGEEKEVEDIFHLE